jgi:hypothetical protein
MNYTWRQICEERKIHQRASLELSPLRMSRLIKFDLTTPIFDKAKFIKSADDVLLLCVALHDLYKWDYTTDLEYTTVYFEDDYNLIYGGLYDEQLHKPLTKKAIATIRWSGRTGSYTYEEKDFVEIKKNIAKRP